MRVLKDISALNSWRRNQEEMALIPTMGALHAGHMGLVSKAQQAVDTVLVSIFVNPTQFNQSSDLDSYPQDLQSDLTQLDEAGIAAVYVPDYEQLYPHGYRFKIAENELSKRFCGAHRPGHFEGVMTVVMKLLQLVRPEYVYFGEKDYQQLQLIKAMVKDFFMPTQVIACPTVRDKDGLALSSRNQRLSDAELNLAPMLYQTLIDDGDLESKKSRLQSLGFQIDYLEVYDDRLMAAVYLGDVRLIDNVPVAGKFI
ncbi:pantoate--beta-alanine ligase [Marinicella gelatinilytica]|uniref:pantoate--beta-alanine ligase n=1 Tax=Marinicella gelatinilytica TaxID=2996017 RepID=UPI002260AC7B|nr:pantoate--beta-alanine ligase [Marinicella gelatinilytica]MCX7544036.1 pantoate--beta-alanine ligase [Marinicella gelatinilytica]